MPRPSQSLVRLQVRQAQSLLQKDVFANLPDERGLEHIEVEPADEPAPDAGSRPQSVWRDRAGRMYLFKVASPQHIAAELFAYRLRRAGRCLHVPTARRVLDVPVLGPTEGMLQPKIPVGGGLDADPRKWSPVQIEVMLREHPWEWLLANLDTHVDQYVLLGAERLPFNIDWDHSLLDLDRKQLTRFVHHSSAVPSIRNLLYSEYVAARIKLDFYGMRVAARRAAEVPGLVVDSLCDKYADDLGLTGEQRRALKDQMRERRKRLIHDFNDLIKSLRLEREEKLGVARTPRSHFARAVSHTQDAWQRFAIRVLHETAVRRFLKGYRAALNMWAQARRKPGAERSQATLTNGDGRKRSF